MIRIFLLGLVATAPSCSRAEDLSRHYNAERGSFCEVSIGRHVPAGLARRTIQVEPEGMPEQRFVVELCEGQLTTELALREDGAVYQIIFTTPGYCLGGVCIGDSFPQVRNRHPDLDMFLTGEEGGLLSLRRSSGDIAYSFDVGDTPIRCFRDIRACPNEWISARVSAIAIRAPT